MDDERQAGYVSKYAIPLLVAISVGALGQAVYVWRDNALLTADLSRLERAVEANTATLRILAEQSATNTVYREEHFRSAADWYRRITELERDVHALQRRPAARPDPFTGTEGRALDERIKKLERRQ